MSCRVLIQAMAVGVGGLYVIYRGTVEVWKYKSFVAQYCDGKEQPLDENTHKLTKEVIDRCNLTDGEEASIYFFTCYGNDVIHKGSSRLRSGAIIGLPATFAYASTDDATTDKMQIMGEPINWESAAGQSLLQSLVLSQNAKAFAIGRGIHYVNTHHVWAEGGLVSAFAMLAYSTGFMLNQVFQLKRILKRWGRFCVYGAIGAISLGMYAIIDDTYKCSRDKGADRRTAALGKDYACGGQEFYNKLLQRNMALRTLMGRPGQMKFTMYGNEQELWRRPHLELTQRRDNLTKILSVYDSKNVTEPTETSD